MFYWSPLGDGETDPDVLEGLTLSVSWAERVCPVSVRVLSVLNVCVLAAVAL